LEVHAFTGEGDKRRGGIRVWCFDGGCYAGGTGCLVVLMVVVMVMDFKLPNSNLNLGERGRLQKLKKWF